MMDALPPFHRAALLLDMDGTLVDLAPTPDAVVVAPDLAAVIITLRDALDGALAIVTGRPIETVDRLFGNAPGAVAGEHGGAIRHRVGAPVERPDLPAPPPSWLEAAEDLVSRHPGALLERKARGFALHYKLWWIVLPVSTFIPPICCGKSGRLEPTRVALLWPSCGIRPSPDACRSSSAMM